MHQKCAISTLLVALILSACASSIMKGYVGQSLMTPVAEYGPPTYAYDMGDGRRAFLWQMRRNVVIPQTSVTNLNLSAAGHSVYGSSITTTTPPAVSSRTCFYTIYAKRVRPDVSGPGAWQVTGYHPPRLSCQ